MLRSTVLVLSLALLVACGSDSEPVDISGSWTTTDDSSVIMNARISGGEIEIIWIADATTHGLYWKGTIPDTASAGETLVSDGDTAAMDLSLLGSQNESKEFKYASDQISFDFTVMGVTQTLYLERI